MWDFLRRRKKVLFMIYTALLAWPVQQLAALECFRFCEIWLIADLGCWCRISASAGQVILAMDPVISILLGLLVNREETQMGPLGWVGGATLMGACILASFYARSEE